MLCLSVFDLNGIPKPNVFVSIGYCSTKPNILVSIQHVEFWQFKAAQ